MSGFPVADDRASALSAVGGTMDNVVRHLPPRIAAVAATGGSGPAGGSLPVMELVGRVDELARLRDLLDSVLVEGSRLALVGGDAGSGKTTVVDAFVRDLAATAADRGAQVIRGQCVPLAIRCSSGPGPAGSVWARFSRI